MSVELPVLPPVPLAVMLGVVEDGRTTRRDAARLALVGAAWPAALAALMIAAIVQMIVEGSSIASALWTAWLMAGTGATFGVVHMARNTPPHRRIRALIAAAAAVGSAIPPLLWNHGAATGGSQLACVVALIGAGWLAGIVLAPVRIATLAYAGGAAVALTICSGGGWPALSALLLLLALGSLTLRLVFADHAAAVANDLAHGEGRFAAKMVAEFEGQGTGWFWEADRQGRVTYISGKVAAEIAAFGPHPVGRALTDIFRMDAATPGTERTLAFHLSSRTSFSDYSVCAAGDRRGAHWWSISGRPALDELGRFSGFIGSGVDLTEKRRSEAEITRLALFDGLTGLANRQRMRFSLDKTLAPPPGQRRPAALFLMDLDRFKSVNDTLGHQAGDELLKQVAQRLLREIGDKGLVGRLGGDEFKVLLPGVDSRPMLADLARAVILALSQPYSVAGTSVTIGCSIGVALAPDHGEDAETLVRNADLALYAAKADGRGVHRFYSPDMLAGARSRQQLEDDLRQALVTGGLHIAYQPVVNTSDERIVGCEALVRWTHPERGPISPAEFIPVAEECGLIEQLGEWVLRTACLDAAAWPGEIRVAVNVSPIQFASAQLPALVTSALARSGLAPSRLELEITEGVFLDETSSSDRMFRALKGIGVRLALDDFGTGYSSLGYLRTAPFDKIKIDQSFVRGAAQPGNRNAAIIRAIVSLADTLGMETTAEGCEVQDEVWLMRDLGCSHIQGYVYGRPMPSADITARLADDAGPTAASGYRISRAPRTRMLRAAHIAIDGVEGDVRLRDISATGAMIEGIAIDGAPQDFDVLIELVKDRMIAAKLRWASDGRAGIEFVEPIDVDLVTNAPQRALRRAG
ncbi:EAL domain-containing protein [Microvirga sp. SRT01]|uniref:EAL domain-containing protein n=1 Tax=Sphingomonas longa TaxID=2778730 RepID=A0ABS2D6D4_9SPHN|nr:MULTISPECIES: EAL domain-containing protein [Alphaproteobacteria]MBM6576470.1 EAL domain-containing protein [Sphingomonas sp. BT552]MBR7709516.1 EAL domain-containing protein [Microvirga sp. SRT01]